MIRLETERLILRKWERKDLEDLYEYGRDERVGPNAGWKPHETIETSRRILESFITGDEVYAVELKTQSKVIGGLGIHRRAYDETIPEEKQREIGYVLNPKFWGLGIIPEAVNRVLQYCFNELDLEVVWCAHFDFNEKSKRVIEKSGFTYRYSEVKLLGNLDNKQVTRLEYSITKEEYEKMSAAR